MFNDNYKGKPFVDKGEMSLWFCEVHACHFSEICSSHPDQCKKVSFEKEVKSNKSND
jgi:hypothetical protein